MELKTNPNNPRRINEKQFEKLKKSIGSFTKMLEIRPIAYDEDKVIWGGNMRYEALKALGIEMKPEYFKELKGFTLEEKREFAIRDNIELGEWDDDILANEWSDLPLDEWGIDTKGWEKEVEEDEVPEVDEESEPVSKLGEIYQLGRHKVMCGDSTQIEAVSALFGPQKADMVFTDPPYNVAYGTIKNHPAWKRTVDTKGRLSTRRAGNDQIMNDSMSDEEWGKFVTSYMEMLFSFNTGAMYICMSNKEMYSNKEKFEALGGHWASFIIWKKDTFVLSMQDYHRQYEPILYGWKEGNKHHWCGDRTQSDVWEVKRPKSSPEHPTMKPIELCGRAITNSSVKDNIVMDLFGGSGSTLIACEQLDRTCFMMELDEKYVDVIRKRYAKFIGKEDEWEKITPLINK